jgi:hypothetical protein
MQRYILVMAVDAGLAEFATLKEQGHILLILGKGRFQFSKFPLESLPVDESVVNQPDEQTDKSEGFDDAQQICPE